jgi:hypothetical protein
MRSVLLAAAVALAVAAPGRADRFAPSAAWLAQARCIHQHEGPWRANTGNGYFGGMQFAQATWLAVGGPTVPAFAHPGDAGFPFAVSARQQLRLAWAVYERDGGTWRSWGAVGARCARTAG